MKGLLSFFNWTFGIGFLSLALVTLILSPVGGLMLSMCGALLLPPFRNFCFEKTKRQISLKTRATLITLLTISSLIAVIYSTSKIYQSESDQLAARRAETEANNRHAARQKIIDEFHENEEKILAEIKAAFDKQDYELTLQLSNTYTIAGNQELNQINDQAREAVAAKLKEEKVNNLLAELKKIPTQEFEENLIRYQELVKLDPEKSAYQDKVKFYSTKIKERQKRQAATTKRKQHIETQFSAWDGSHKGLERYIKLAMNDPDSYDHAGTRYWDKGEYLIVQTTFRGKNAFGGVVKNTIKAKVSLNGQVLEIIDQF